jgi:outer membrane protein OmpA-like peptidoglycan-associated protein
MMIKYKKTGCLAVAVFMVMSAEHLLVSGSILVNQPQDTSTPSSVHALSYGREMKITGIVIKRNADTFTLRDQASVEIIIALTPNTSVKTYKKGVFRGGKEYAVSHILRGLRLQVNGRGNAKGQLVAEIIRFDENDLRTAQALQVRIDPVEELAEENRRRIAAAEEEARRQAVELEKNKAAAQKAQVAADEALKSATIANNRINGLDDYDPVRTITVLFATGAATLGPKGRAEIDKAAAWVKTQNTKGWVVAVVGFADTTGNTEANRRLSQHRANAVIGYLVTKHHLPLQRLVQPFGYGESNPVTENLTAEGRAKNRRVEIRLLINKGIANVP